MPRFLRLEQAPCGSLLRAQPRRLSWRLRQKHLATSSQAACAFGRRLFCAYAMVLRPARIGAWTTDFGSRGPLARLFFQGRHALGWFGTEPMGNEFDPYDSTIVPHHFAIALNTVLEQHQGKNTGYDGQWSGKTPAGAPTLKFLED